MGELTSFEFDLSWFTKDEFYNRVAKVWNNSRRGWTLLQRWHNKIRTVRRYLKGWAKKVVDEDRRKMKFLVDQLDVLDQKYEFVLLSPQE